MALVKELGGGGDEGKETLAESPGILKRSWLDGIPQKEVIEED